MKNRPVGDELFHEGGRAGGQAVSQTYTMKLIVVFRSFAQAPSKGNTVE